MNYVDKTDILKKMKTNKKSTIKRLMYFKDEQGKYYHNCYFESNKKILNEIKYQKLIESKIGYNVYLVPLVKENGIRTPDYWIEELNEYWDFKNLDGNSRNLIDNVVGNAKGQTHNLLLKQNKTSHDISYLKKQIVDVYDSPYRLYINQIVLLDRHNNIVLYYKRKNESHTSQME